jgi:hypothetical protein
MAKAIKFDAAGQEILIEIIDEADLEVESEGGTAGSGDKVANMAGKLNEVSAAILTVCSAVYEKAYLALGAARPAEMEIEFGVTLAGEAGIPLVTKGNVECNLKVTARWARAAET